MNQVETGRFLAVVSAVDNRILTRETISVWHDLIGHLSVEAAMAALKEHRSTSTEYLQPAHIIALAKQLAPRTDRGIARPPAPAGKRYAVDVIEMGVLE